MNKFLKISNYLIVANTTQLVVIDCTTCNNVTTKIAEELGLLCNKRLKTIKLYQYNAAIKVQNYLCELTSSNAVII
jgi:hypothetical protein